MPIDIDIAHVAQLARIALGPDEEELYRSQLGVILDHAARVQAADTDGVPPTAHPLPMVNAFREDIVRPGLSHSDALHQAPDAHDGYFRVPPALDVE